MEDTAYYLSEGIITFVFLGIGARLLHRSFRTHATPERLLGASFLLWGLSTPLFDVPEALGVDELVLAPFANTSRICWQTGTAIMALFVKKTFRNSDPRATWLVVGVAALLVGSGMGSVWVGDYGGDYPLSNPWWWLEWAGSVIPMIWISMEASVHYARVRQRRWLGEGDALLCNRIGLWCFVGLTWTLVECITAAQYVIYELTLHWLVSLSVALAVLELGGAAMVWLVFNPPVIYKSWINRNAIPQPRAA
jgi:hypothetical protein